MRNQNQAGLPGLTSRLTGLTLVVVTKDLYELKSGEA